MMKAKGFWWFVAGVFLLITGQILLIRNENLGPETVLKNEAARIKVKLEQTVTEFNAILKSGEIRRNSLDLDSLWVQKLKNSEIEFFVFENQRPVFWTTNAYDVKPGDDSGIEIHQHASKFVVQWTRITDSLTYVFSREIISNPEFRFISSSSVQETRSNKFSVSVNPVEYSVPIEAQNVPLFYLVIEQFTPGIFSDLLILLGLIFITWAGFLYFRKEVNPYPGFFALWLLWCVVEWLFYKNQTLWNLKDTALFAPELYASSEYFPNLGVFIFNFILGFVFLHLILGWIKQKLEIGMNKGLRAFLQLFALVLLATFVPFFIVEIAKLVRDSSINFDFHEIHLISFYTIAGLVGLAFGFGIVYNLAAVLRMLTATNKKWTLWTWFAITVSISSWFVYKNSELLFAIMNAFFLTALFFTTGPWIMAHKYWRYAVQLLLPCVILSVLFDHQVNVKEKELREILSAKLLLQSEREPSNLLIKTEQQLSKDKGIVDYYTCTDVSKSDFEKRLRQFYFSEYSEDYEILIFDYNQFGFGYREENPFDFSTLSALYSGNSCKPVTRNFSLVNERKLKGSFLGKFPVQDTGGFYGTYFVMLKPRVGAAQGRLSDVFHKSPLEALFTDNQYSYAVYSENKLSRRYGQFYYPNKLPFQASENLYYSGGFSHYAYSDDLGNVIVISKPEKGFLQTFSAFTILVLSNLFIALLYYLVLMLRQFFIAAGNVNFSKLRLLYSLRLKMPGRFAANLFLSRKLQLYVILVVFATFIVVLFVTINYFKTSYSARQQDFLWNKTNEIANTIGTQANLDALFQQYQTGLIYDLSNYYSTDINLYNASGKLLVSSNDRIYEQALVGSLMNPKAFREFRVNGISGFIKEEKIGDLKYISAYYSIFDNDLNVKGYLNLPYFTNRQELYREISNYSSTVINLFALVFALAAIVAYVIAHRITEPLNLIRRQMGVVKLGAKNAPIKWEHNDEIGLLIAEYNKMLTELEESTNKLAEGERQGAWREMAKQVAHEIKNPLTPMKLSLQHLQFAIERNDPNIAERMKKTSELLINQIDSLSRMAEEFSAFAKMPEARLEVQPVNGILDESVRLFQEEKHVTFHYTPLDNIVMVNVDAHQLSRVFTNIIKNAIQAIPEDKKGLVRIHGKVFNQSLEVHFEDNGKGIPLELHGKIFSPNFSTKNSGMGLGLAISRKILDQFSGNIRFTSVEGKGTVFIVTMPVVSE